MRLSKSRYCSGIQCPKILWMEKNMPEYYDDSLQSQQLLNTGIEVGNLARYYFSDVHQIEYNTDKNIMIEQTRDFIDSGAATIAEASFAYDGNFCSIDILQIYNDGVEIFEVKSAASVSEIHMHDMAFQCWILIQNGYQVKKPVLMHINNRYVRQGELDLAQLFTLEDCSDVVFPMMDDVESNIAAIKALAESVNEPDNDIGKYCNVPYTCGYKKWCWRHIPQDSVFDISRFSKSFSWYYDGVLSMGDVLSRNIKLSEKQRTQVETTVNYLPPSINIPEIRSYLQTFSFPLYFLDFETYMPAIPEHDGMRPYMQVPFQYSLHIKMSASDEEQHKEFLAQTGTDPRRALAERLCEDIPVDVCVIAYNMTFEKQRIKELADYFPDLLEHLMSIHENMKDLMIPFQRHWYYSREMCGSYSIKQVLPAVCPNDPDLDYSALKGIHNGVEAMNAFAALSEKSEDEAESIRRNLLKYCRLDTLAMVRIWERLDKIHMFPQENL